MHKLKKAAAVVAMVGGIGLAGGGVAHADGGYGHDGPNPFIDNLQVVKCDQAFDAGDAFVGPVAGGENNSNIGNFCTTVGSID